MVYYFIWYINTWNSIIFIKLWRISEVEKIFRDQLSRIGYPEFWYSTMRWSIICNFHPLSEPRFLFKLRLFGYLVNNLSFEICSVSLTSRSIIIMGLYIIMITNWEESESAREVCVCAKERQGEVRKSFFLRNRETIREIFAEFLIWVGRLGANRESRRQIIHLTIWRI